jgi:hypothetical protein
MNDEIKNETPDSALSIESKEALEMDRGGCLTVFLIFLIIGNACAVATYLLLPEIVKLVSPDASETWSYVLSGGGILNIVFAILTWFWKKIGVFGFLAIALSAFGINIYLSIPLAGVIMGLVGPFIFAFLVKSRWQKFS